MSNKTKRVLRIIRSKTPKTFLTIADLDVIENFLGEKKWNKFIKMSRDKRVELGLKILRKLKQGAGNGKQ